MSPFDALIAAREELTRLQDIHRTLRRREQRCEEAMSVAEQELNAIRKLSGYCRITIERLQDRIADLEQKS